MARYFSSTRHGQTVSFTIEFYGPVLEGRLRMEIKEEREEGGGLGTKELN